MNSWELHLEKTGQAHSPTLGVNDLQPYAYAGQQTPSPWEHSIWDGGKFAGGFGPTQLQDTDYWTLRARSTQLFNENLYARGLIRRLITNEINTGIWPEAKPDESVLGLPEDALADWSEDVETRFSLWGNSPEACDWAGVRTFAEIQRVARLEALVAGDVLVVMRQNRTTGVPRIQLINGANVQTPLTSSSRLRAGHTIEHGVEFDSVGRVAAHWVLQADGSSKRLPARGERSGRRISWLVYGTERRLDDVRGQPLLSLVLQSLKEIDRYRDSALRKAVINSIIAMFVKKGEDRPGTLPLTGGAVRRDSAQVSDSTTNGEPRQFNVGSYLPGLTIDELQYGEEIVVKGGEGTDVNFGTFEAAVIQSYAWANNVPPEILTMAFSNNYSASQAAINEFKIYLNMIWGQFGESFCAPIYQEWLISQVLTRRITARGLLDVWRDKSRYDEFAAWVSADWYGSIKPSTDMLKQVKASELLVAGGYSSRAREARITTGTKFSQNAKRVRRENEQLAAAREPLQPVESDQPPATEAIMSAIEALTERVEALSEGDQ